MEWLTNHWAEFVFGTIIVLIVRGDTLLRLVKKGREDEKRERDVEVDRRLAPMKERAESAEKLATTRGMERDEAVKALQTCVDDRAALAIKVNEQNEQIVKLVALQPEVFRITGELEEMGQRLRVLEDLRRSGGGGRHRHEDSSR